MADPRSRWNTTMTSEIPHMSSSGSIMRKRGNFSPKMLCALTERSSRFSERYDARKRTMSTLAISPGWNEKPANLIHSLEPQRSYPMKMGSTSSRIPTMMMVYLYLASFSSDLVLARTTIIMATERKSHITCRTAISGASRVTNVMPMPESTNTMGRIAGSAEGAKILTDI